MAKRRERPVQNPLRRDLVSRITGPVSTPVQSAQVVTEVRPSEKDGVPTEIPLRRRKPEKWERSTVTMKTRFVPAESRENREFADMLGRLMKRLGDDSNKRNVTESHVTRALWSLARRASEELEDLAGKAPKLRRPPHGDGIATAEFEDAIANYLLLALKRMRRGE